MKIENKTRGIVPVKMQPIDPDAGFHVKEIFFERDIVFELEILFEFLWFKDEFFLEKINQDRQENETADDIPDECRQDGLWFIVYCFWLLQAS